MKQIYDNVNPVLLKLEDMVLHTTGGKASKMRDYYEYWENLIYESLTMMTVNNITNFNDKLNGKVPLFQVDIILLEPEPMMRPTPSEIYSIIIRNVKDFLEKLKSFPRYMQGTCWYCEPQKLEKYDEYYTFSFYEDIIQHEMLAEYFNKIRKSVHSMILAVQTNMQRYILNLYYNLGS